MNHEMRDDVVDLLASWGAPARPLTADLWAAIIAAEQTPRTSSDLTPLRRELDTLLRAANRLLPADWAEGARTTVAALDAGRHDDAIASAARRWIEQGWEQIDRRRSERHRAVRETLATWDESLDPAPRRRAVAAIEQLAQATTSEELMAALDAADAVMTELQQAQRGLLQTLRDELGAGHGNLSPELVARAEQSVASGQPSGIQRLLEEIRAATQVATRARQRELFGQRRRELQTLIAKHEAAPGRSTELNDALSGGAAALALGESVDDEALEATIDALSSWRHLIEQLAGAPAPPSGAAAAASSLRPALDEWRERLAALPSDARNRLTTHLSAAETAVHAAEAGGGAAAAALERLAALDAAGSALLAEAKQRLESEGSKIATLLAKPDDLPLGALLAGRLALERARAPLGYDDLAMVEEWRAQLQSARTELEAAATQARALREQRLSAERAALKTEAESWASQGVVKTAARLQQIARAAASSAPDALAGLRRDLDQQIALTRSDYARRAGVALASAATALSGSGKKGEATPLGQQAEAVRQHLLADDLAALGPALTKLETLAPKPGNAKVPWLIAGGGLLLVIAIGAALALLRGGGAAPPDATAVTIALRIDDPPARALDLVLVRDGAIAERTSFPAGQGELTLSLKPGRYDAFLAGRLAGAFDVPGSGPPAELIAPR